MDTVFPWGWGMETFGNEIAQHRECTKCHSVVHFKKINLTLC